MRRANDVTFCYIIFFYLLLLLVFVAWLDPCFLVLPSVFLIVCFSDLHSLLCFFSTSLPWAHPPFFFFLHYCFLSLPFIFPLCFSHPPPHPPSFFPFCLCNLVADWPVMCGLNGKAVTTVQFWTLLLLICLFVFLSLFCALFYSHWCCDTAFIKLTWKDHLIYEVPS